MLGNFTLTIFLNHIFWDICNYVSKAVYMQISPIKEPFSLNLNSGITLGDFWPNSAGLMPVSKCAAGAKYPRQKYLKLRE
jgi:hypothetical protein